METDPSRHREGFGLDRQRWRGRLIWMGTRVVKKGIARPWPVFSAGKGPFSGQEESKINQETVPIGGKTGRMRKFWAKWNREPGARGQEPEDEGQKTAGRNKTPEQAGSMNKLAADQVGNFGSGKTGFSSTLNCFYPNLSAAN